jgi:gentisate 1,2-dioxygenase
MQAIDVSEWSFEGRFADWTGDARYFEYTKAVNPIGAGLTPRIPIRKFPAALHQGGPTRIVALDLAGDLGVDRPATSPGLLASFVRIEAGDDVATAPNATSELYYVLSGKGTSSVNGETVAWRAGDVLTLPAGSRSTHRADVDAVLYWVHDEPLLHYLGVQATVPRFRPTRYPAERSRAELARVAAAPRAANRNRISVLLANAEQPQSLTVTHVLWAMLGLLPAGQMQPPHRHQSVALDLIIDCPPEGCYTLVGNRLDDNGRIVDPTRVDWRPGCAFVTPPGLWHAHHNESGQEAHLIPVQDAGLHTYLRSLDIRFTTRVRMQSAS